jgi:hypothetical protein
VAIERKLLLIPGQGIDQCAAISIAHDTDQDIGTARVLGGCPNQPAGALTKLGSGICADHIKQLDEEGAFILE